MRINEPSLTTTGILRRHIKLPLLLSLVLIVILAVACALSTSMEGSAVSPTVTASPPVVDFWDGGQFGGQPVYSPNHGITKAAHDTIRSCGPEVPTVVAAQAVENYKKRQQPIIIQAGLPEGRILWSAKIVVEPLAAEVYKITCISLPTPTP